MKLDVYCFWVGNQSGIASANRPNKAAAK